jgi:DNA-binding IclR family transcriptional regulator
MSADTIGRALALLEAVARIGPGASAKQIASATGTPPATAYRLLNVLVAEGYLVRIEDLSGFALGRRTRELAGAAEEPTDNAYVLTQLRGQLRFGIHLAGFTPDGIRIVDKDPDHELVGQKTMTTSPHASAVGKVMLAHTPHRCVDFARVTSRTLTAEDAVAAELDRVRRSGVATEVDESRVGRSALAVPVRDDDSAVAGALVAIGPTGRLDVEDAGLRELLQDYAGRVRVLRSKLFVGGG